MSPERQREYDDLSAFIDFHFTKTQGLDRTDPIHPINVLKEIVQQYGKSKALDGLRQATNDALEELSARSAGEVARLDIALGSAGIITVSELRRRYASSYKRIVKRGAIRTETEYHLIHGIVIDLSSAVTDDERSQLQRLLEAYEQDA